MKRISFVFIALAVIASWSAAFAQAVLLAGGGGGSGPSVPTSISLSGSTIFSTAPQGTQVGQLSTTGGTAPYTYTLSNSKFQISGNWIIRSSTGTLTAGSPESVNVTSTDTNGFSTNTATNGQGPFSITVNTPPAGTTITTIAFNNTSGSTIAANSVSPMFGLAFNKGDIASGCTTGAPQFILADLTVLSFSESTKPSCWSDGSLKYAAFMVADSESLPSGSTSVTVLNGGTYPSASSRTLSDFASGSCDLNNQVVGLDNLSGTWTSDLNQGISANGADYKYIDGPAGTVWRVRASYRQSGANHGNLEGFWYVMSIQDHSGALGGVRYLVRTTAPWYNVASPTPQFLSFSSYKDYNGASLLQDLWSTQETGYSVTATSGNVNYATSGIVWQSGNLIQITSGTPPTGLTSNTSYFVFNGNGGDIAYTTTTFKLSAYSDAAQGSYISPGSNATFTATSYPYITQFGSLFDATSTARWNFIQCGGSFSTDVAGSQVQVIPSNTYTRKSKLIPPYNFSTFTVVDNASYSFWPMTAGPLTRSLGNTGFHPDIGPLPRWAAKYWWNQTNTDDQLIRLIGLTLGNWPINLRDNTTKAIPVVNNGHNNIGGSYSGMPAPVVNLLWAGDNAGTPHGITTPGNSKVWAAGYNQTNTGHIPDFEWSAYLVTGEPQYMDMQEEIADYSVYSRSAATITAATVGSVTSMSTTSQRNFLISGTNYYGAMFEGGDGMRQDGWGLRAVEEAATINDPENASYNQYFNDLEQVNANAALAYLNLFSPTSYPYVNGMWAEQVLGAADNGSTNKTWMESYLVDAYAMGADMNESTNDVTFLTYLAKWPAHINSSFGIVNVPYYSAILRQSPNVAWSPLITSDAGFSVENLALTWQSTSTTFTVANLTWTGNVVSNGDLVVMGTTNPGTNFASGGDYYVCNLSGSTFQLQTSSGCGGSALQPTNNQTNIQEYGISSAFSGTGKCACQIIASSGDGYALVLYASLLWSQETGATVDSTTMTNLNTLITGNTYYYSALQNYPTFWLQSSR